METTDKGQTTANTPKGHKGRTEATDDHRQGGDSVEANQAETPDGIGGKMTPATDATD